MRYPCPRVGVDGEQGLQKPSLSVPIIPILLVRVAQFCLVGVDMRPWFVELSHGFQSFIDELVSFLVALLQFVGICITPPSISVAWKRYEVVLQVDRCFI